MTTWYNRLDYKPYYSIVDCRRSAIKEMKRNGMSYSGIYADDYIANPNNKGGLIHSPKSKYKVWAYESFESNKVYKLNQDGTLGEMIRRWKL